jgi:hypothetical protein
LDDFNEENPTTDLVNEAERLRAEVRFLRR